MAEAAGGRARLTVVGGGLAGCAAAILLARRGARVTVCEGRPDPRGEGGVGGRSINLALSVRGLAALERVGLREAVLAGAVEMRGRMIHGPAGELTFQPYGTGSDDVIHSVSRSELNMELLEAAGREPRVELRFGQRCLDVDLETATVTLEGSGGRQEEVAGDAVVGADGAFSAVRARMQRTDRFDYSQSYLSHGYKELTIPPTPDGGFALEPHALHIWPRGGFMMIALPNRDGSFTCTLFWPFQGPNSFAALTGPDDVLAFFRRTFPDAVPVMPDLAREYLDNPVSSLVTVRCAPWHVRDRVVLIGDACHAVVPFYGQGANAALEDCLLLDDALAAHPEDRERAFAAYGSGRKPHADALADLALGNFVEMRDATASRLFLARKGLERLLHRLAPRSFVPLYSMVSFSRTPYADAVERARRQWRTVLALAAVPAGLLVILAAALGLRLLP